MALINPAGDLVVRPSECQCVTAILISRTPAVWGMRCRWCWRCRRPIDRSRMRPALAAPPCPVGFLEHRAHRSSLRSSVAQHLLTAYNASLAAVLRGQCEGKGITCVRAHGGRGTCTAPLPLVAWPLGCRHAPSPGSPLLPPLLCNSGGPQALVLLAANPATRELLVRPLAIRPQSLRRYLGSSSAAAAPPPGPTTLGVPETMEVVVEAPASDPAGN